MRAGRRPHQRRRRRDRHLGGARRAARPHRTPSRSSRRDPRARASAGSGTLPRADHARPARPGARRPAAGHRHRDPGRGRLRPAGADRSRCAAAPATRCSRTRQSSRPMSTSPPTCATTRPRGARERRWSPADRRSSTCRTGRANGSGSRSRQSSCARPCPGVDVTVSELRTDPWDFAIALNDRPSRAPAHDHRKS